VNHNRFASIQNKTISVAMNWNTGGWKESYNKNATQFDTNLTNWKGPLVDFFQTASKMGLKHKIHYGMKQIYTLQVIHHLIYVYIWYHLDMLIYVLHNIL
jgi:hypothetical protein